MKMQESPENAQRVADLNGKSFLIHKVTIIFKAVVWWQFKK